MTTLVSTHYMDEAERCTRLAYLAYGDLLITGTVSEIIASTKLLTWQIQGKITTGLLQRAKRLVGVVQAVLFGNQIHVCGFNKDTLEIGLTALAKDTGIHWQLTDTTLEDAFISLVNQEPGFQGLEGQ